MSITTTINPNAQGSYDNWINGNGADKVAAVADTSDSPSGINRPQDADVPPSDYESYYFEDLPAAVASSATVSNVLVKAAVAAPLGAPFFSATITIGVRTGAGSWGDSSAQSIPANGGTLEYAAPKPGGGTWTKGEIDALEVRLQFNWGTDETQPYLTKVWADITYAGTPPSYDAGREGASRLLRLRRRIQERVRITTPNLSLLDAELLDDLMIQHFAANTADGLGWGVARGDRGLVEPLSISLDPDNLTIKPVLDALRALQLIDDDNDQAIALVVRPQRTDTSKNCQWTYITLSLEGGQ